MGLVVCEAVEACAASLLKRPLRQVDVDEWVGASGRPVANSLLATLRDSRTKGRSLYLRGQCLCIWGVSQVLPDSRVGSVWLLASVEAEKHAHAIHKLWKHEITLMHKVTPFLMAFVYERNALHKKWLKTVGFTPMAGVQSPLLGYRFYQRYQPNV